MIEIAHIYKSYNSQKEGEYAVSDVSITVPQGKIIGLLGPNGSGKTTIMKAICGFHYVSKGTVTVSGIDINQNPEKAMEKTGYVPEISMLPGELTVTAFLDYVCAAHNIENAPDKIKEISAACGIENLLQTKIKKLSKGQQQRVSFAQCLIYNPENLILDEPVSGLDPAQIQNMRKLIKELSKTKAVLLSTHILSEISSLCDEIYILNKGKIVASGTEEQIIKQTEEADLEAAFIKLTGESD